MSGSVRDSLRMMARYHLWATQRVLDAAETVPEEAYRRPLGLFFGSLHGTLNHLLLTDAGYWYPRFSGTPMTTLPLDGEAEADRAALADQLRTAAAAWEPLVAGLDDAALAGDLHYRQSTGQPRTLPRTAVLFHVFNHATHHRGQATAALTILGATYDAIDLPVMLFEKDAGDR